MTTDPNERASSIFAIASRIASTGEREAYLSDACGQDTELRRLVDALFDAGDATAELTAASSHSSTPRHDTRQSTDLEEDQIGPYKILEPLGQGGMGTVYVAQQLKPLRRKVALKLIKPGMDSKSVIARFEAERQALAVMDHPNIAKVLDAGTSTLGRPFFVMELVRGKEITRYCDEHKLSLPARLTLFTQVCQAIQHAHQKGIIHRDIKPSNVLVGEMDGTAVPKVIDFGVAKAIGHSLTDNTIHTGFQSVIGTPLYMSPEQASGGGVDIDTRSDVYSLGALLYELLTGFTPFEQQDLQQAAQDEVLKIIREQTPLKPSTKISKLGLDARKVSDARRTDISSLGRSVRGELDWIVMKALEKERARRYDTAQQFILDIENYLAGRAVLAGPPSAWYQLSKSMRRHRRAMASLVTAFILLVIIAGVLWQNNRRLTTALADVRRAESEASSLNKFFILDLLGQADPNQNPFQEQTTVVELLDRAAAEIKNSQAFTEEPLVEASIQRVIGTSYYALGRWLLAEKHLTRAIELRKQWLGDEDPKTLEAISNLLDVQIELEQFDKAGKAAELLVRNHKKRHGNSHHDTLLAQLTKSRVLLLTGRYPEAETLARSVLDIASQTSDQESEVLLRARQSLADTLTTQFTGFDEAKSTYEQNVAALLKDGRDPSSHEILTVKLRLAECQIASGETEKAEQLYQEILTTRETSTLPQDHPHTILARTTLGLAQCNQGKFGVAAENLRRAYDQALTTLGDSHQTTWLARRGIILVNSLCIALSPNRSEVAKETLALAKQNLELISTKGWPASHSNAYQTKVDLGMALAIHGAVMRAKAGPLGAFSIPKDLTAAEALFEELYADRMDRFGPEHIETVGSGMQLMQVRALTNPNPQEMESFARHLLATTNELPPGFPVRANICNALGTVLSASSQYTDAEPYLREYFQFCRTSSNVSELDRHTAVEGLTSNLISQKNREKPLRTMSINAEVVYRARVTKTNATPILVARAEGSSAFRSSNEAFTAHESLMYLSPKQDISISFSAISLAEQHSSDAFELDVEQCNRTVDKTESGIVESNGELDAMQYSFPRFGTRIPMKSGRLYRIEVSSDAFHPLLRIESPDHRVLKWTTDSSKNAISLDFIATNDGAHDLIITPSKREDEGDFTFRVQEFSPGENL